MKIHAYEGPNLVSVTVADLEVYKDIICSKKQYVIRNVLQMLYFLYNIVGVLNIRPPILYNLLKMVT